MNRNLLAMGLAAVLCLSGVVRADPASKGVPPTGVQWQKDLKAAHQISMQQNKPLLLVFGADWCGYCHKLERNVINHPEMAAYINANFIPVHLDADTDKKVAEILEVESLPCTVVLAPNADLLGKFVGYSDLKTYARKLAETQELHQRVTTTSGVTR